MRLGGVVLAAGASRRAGVAKALAELEGEALVARAVRCLREGGCERVWVVVGPPHGERVAAAVDAERVENPDPGRGMLSSLKRGLVAARDSGCAAVLVSLVNHPRVVADTVRSLVSAWEQAGAWVVRPRYGTERGHPYLLARDAFGPLLSLADDADPRPTLRSLPRQLDVDVDDSAVLEDIDDPEQLAALG